MNLRSIALAFAFGTVAASALAAGPNINSYVAAPSGAVPLAGVPASLSGSGSWTSACVAASPYRAFDVFAAIAAAGTLQVRRYADAACTYPAGPAIPASPLALASGGSCPSATTCGDVASNDGLPFLALKITLTDTSAATNVITTVVLIQGAE